MIQSIMKGERVTILQDPRAAASVSAAGERGTAIRATYAAVSDTKTLPTLWLPILAFDVRSAQVRYWTPKRNDWDGMKRIRQSWRELCILLRSVWVNLALFAGLIAAVSLLLKLTRCYGDTSWGEAFVRTLYLTRIEGVLEGCRYPNMAVVLVYAMPLLTVLILGEGVLRLIALYLSRHRRSDEWEELMVANLKGHMVICGAGELGRALLQKVLEDGSRRSIVVIDKNEGILQELGIHDENVHHIYGDMTSYQTLKLANVAQCATVIITSGDDAHNLETATKAYGLNPGAEIWVRLYRTALSNLMDTTSKPNIKFFSPYNKAAETLAERLEK